MLGLREALCKVLGDKLPLLQSRFRTQLRCLDNVEHGVHAPACAAYPLLSSHMSTYYPLIWVSTEGKRHGDSSGWDTPSQGWFKCAYSAAHLTKLIELGWNSCGRAAAAVASAATCSDASLSQAAARPLAGCAFSTARAADTAGPLARAADAGAATEAGACVCALAAFAA